MRILTVPEDTATLRTKSRPVEKIDAELLALLKELGETLKKQKDPAGVGLSAIQVGRPVRAFAMLLPEQRQKEEGRRKKEEQILRFYVNPEITDHSKDMTLGEDLVDPPKDSSRSHLGGQERLKPFLEGCLSIPDIYGPVLRWSWIKAKTMVIRENDLLDISRHGRLDLQLIDVSLNGLEGRVFQHELDHLNGILFTDHVLRQGNRLCREEEKELVEMEM